MNREEAKQALIDGERLTHTYFSDDEWVESGAMGRYVFEDGCLCSYQEFWAYRKDKSFDEGWSVKK